MNFEDIKLTQYSHGAGCGCKISPAVLSTILHTETPQQFSPNLIVGNAERDDAAVLDLGNDYALISTTDFFMPIVDNPYNFGKIAAANSISDIYAMGGKPILAIAILGWPISKLAPEVAAQVLEGARSICKEAGIAISGGHSIDSPEPIFGLAVNGMVALENLKRNSTATAGCKLYLTKPLGVGALSTAQKQGKLLSNDAEIILESMTKLNRVGEKLGKISGVSAMTDVTGFGLLGHLCEMCEGSKVSAEIEFAKVPVIASLNSYLEQNCIPGGTNRNWLSYGHKVSQLSERQIQVLADPQTNGGLLIAVEENTTNEFEQLMQNIGYPINSFGRLIPQTDSLLVTVI